MGPTVPPANGNTTVDDGVQTDIQLEHSGIQIDIRFEDNGVETDPHIQDNSVQTDRLLRDNCEHTDILIHDVLDMDMSSDGPMEPVSNINDNDSMTGERFMQIASDEASAPPPEEDTVESHTVRMVIQCRGCFLWSFYFCRTLMDRCCHHALGVMSISMLRIYQSFLKRLSLQIQEVIRHRAPFTIPPCQSTPSLGTIRPIGWQ
jgi:hypothetical protein